MHSPMNKSPNALRRALTAAKEGRRAALIASLSHLHLRDDDGAPIDEIWLAGEMLYQQGSLPEALALLDRYDEDPRSRRAPSWQLYMASHRRSVIYLRMGNIAGSAKALEDAESRLGASPTLSSRKPDLDALRAHLVELRGDFEGARALLERAHTLATSHAYWHRATTIASDLGRILGVLGRPADALEWLDVARRNLKRSPDRRVEQTIDLRFGMLLTLQEKHKEALVVYNRVIKEAQSHPAAVGILVDTLGRRADVKRKLGQHQQAEKDLRLALETSSSRHSVRQEIYLHIDLAALLLEVNEGTREHLAQAEFAVALRLALGMHPPQSLILSQLAERILREPRLLGSRRLRSDIRDDMKECLLRLRSLTRSHMYQQTTHDQGARRALRSLVEILMYLDEPEMHLASCVVMPLAGKVKAADGFQQIDRAQLLALREIMQAPEEGITSSQLADRLDISLDAANKRIGRLRNAVGSDLVVRRRGNTRLYSVRRP